MSKGSGITRGDRKRNARRERLRAVLPRDGAVTGIDLAEDKQALAAIDAFADEFLVPGDELRRVTGELAPFENVTNPAWSCTCSGISG